MAKQVAVETDFAAARRPMRRRLSRWLGALAGIVALAIAGFLLWALTPLGPDTVALDALESDADVSVVRTEIAWEFAPASEDPRVGLIFYPGGRVDARSYAPLARELARNGYLVAIVPMPLNLAVLSPDRADGVIAGHPEIAIWTIAGHSLGGAMAAQYADENRATISGLGLLAAYPPSTTDLGDAEMQVVSVYGTRDGVLSEENFSEGMMRLPADVSVVGIDGANHAGFGSYGEQPGDNPAEIGPEEQLEATVETLGRMLVPLRIRAGTDENG